MKRLSHVLQALYSTVPVRFGRRIRNQSNLNADLREAHNIIVLFDEIELGDKPMSNTGFIKSKTITKLKVITCECTLLSYKQLLNYTERKTGESNCNGIFSHGSHSSLPDVEELKSNHNQHCCRCVSTTPCICFLVAG